MFAVKFRYSVRCCNSLLPSQGMIGRYPTPCTNYPILVNGPSQFRNIGSAKFQENQTNHVSSKKGAAKGHGEIAATSKNWGDVIKSQIFQRLHGWFGSLLRGSGVVNAKENDTTKQKQPGEGKNEKRKMRKKEKTKMTKKAKIKMTKEQRALACWMQETELEEKTISRVLEINPCLQGMGNAQIRKKMLALCNQLSIDNDFEFKTLVDAIGQAKLLHRAGTKSSRTTIECLLDLFDHNHATVRSVLVECPSILDQSSKKEYRKSTVASLLSENLRRNKVLYQMLPEALSMQLLNLGTGRARSKAKKEAALVVPIARDDQVQESPVEGKSSVVLDAEMAVLPLDPTWFLAVPEVRCLDGKQREYDGSLFSRKLQLIYCLERFQFVGE